MANESTNYIEFLSISDFYLLGVVSLVPPAENNPNNELILIENKFETGLGYSGNTYDMLSATKDGIIYPSLDPSIFELKNPDSDIEGRVVGDR